MLFEKQATCIRPNPLFEADILLAVSITAVSLLQFAWRVLDARAPRSTTERRLKDDFF